MSNANPQLNRQHSFNGAEFCIPRVEDPQTLDRLRAGLIAAYRPVNSQELFAVERIAFAQLSLFRAARLKAGIFSSALNEGPSGPLTQRFQRLSGKACVVPNFLRYQAQAKRHYRRAVEGFKRLQRLRKELANDLTGPCPDPAPITAAPIAAIGAATVTERPAPPSHRAEASLR